MLTRSEARTYLNLLVSQAEIAGIYSLSLALQHPKRTKTITQLAQARTDTAIEVERTLTAFFGEE